MEMLQDQIPLLYNLYNTYYLPYEPYLRPFRRYLFLAQSYTFTYIYPTLYPLYRLSNAILSRLLTSNPDITSLALLALVLFLSLKIMNMLRRQVIYWISVGVRLAMWGGMGLLGLYVYERGVEQSFEDAQLFVGWLVGVGREGERIGERKGRERMADARRVKGEGPRGRTRGGGW